MPPRDTPVAPTTPGERLRAWIDAQPNYLAADGSEVRPFDLLDEVIAEARASTPLDVVPNHVVDRDNHVWRIVRDGGMAVRGHYNGIESIGIEQLRRERGPLYPVARLTTTDEGAPSDE